MRRITADLVQPREVASGAALPWTAGPCRAARPGSATAVPADVAAAVAGLVARVAAGETAELPAMTPLSAAALTVNADAAAALGLPPVAVQRWVAREAD